MTTQGERETIFRAGEVIMREEARYRRTKLWNLGKSNDGAERRNILMDLLNEEVRIDPFGRTDEEELRIAEIENRKKKKP
ncbi:hypothetical protein A3A76_06090 [Candidatus Woesebacteria bacterium RIFCSPLOWO2_01_FULL_39_23]|uniref:Uncharacterized protein n=1 Tax=Candidatus Woesebacteria bacterium RIFCSPHIGHO2_01_FULL_40_22 TaxID=1802499 RepID=A0A1F7YI76_9BACT|nr:MAG: hypothetical protein A2141_02785 [Candidatus Woesebacteria bacterium RBG_16_40_11]OGM26972.1 MAG: hypothetical protein A2628_06030 [Candidatus Woesebacteria bacterium RIFCSPHIGHO2_01_FULL_40_22]OGM63247.1 MAG: hypothetical protein A3A76_06090 [Candidatus Woesebacteria bacterium RIFCSPLOWO2_01_FULL_39_23]